MMSNYKKREDTKIQIAYILGVLVGKGLDDPKAICSVVSEWIRLNEPSMNDKEITAALTDIVYTLKKIEKWKYC